MVTPSNLNEGDLVPSGTPKDAPFEAKNNRGRSCKPTPMLRKSSTQLLDVQSVKLEKVSELRTCLAMNPGKGVVSEEYASTAASSPSASKDLDATPSGSFGGTWVEWYSTSISGFVVTEWFNFLDKTSQEMKKGGKTRTLEPEQIMKVELKIHDTCVDAVCASDGSCYVATWSRPDGMRFPVDARLQVTYRAHQDVLETRPLKVSLRDSASASQFCVLQ